MKKRVKKRIGLVGIIALVLFGGVITSYAIGPGEVSQTVTKPVTYNQQAVQQLGNWRQNANGTWSFLKFNDQAVCNAWLESLDEPGAFYYVDNNGNMMVNATTPDGYQVDVNGLWRSGIKVQESEAANSETEKSTVKYDQNGNQIMDYSYLFENPEYQKFIQDHPIDPSNNWVK